MTTEMFTVVCITITCYCRCALL